MAIKRYTPIINCKVVGRVEAEAENLRALCTQMYDALEAVRTGTIVLRQSQIYGIDTALRAWRERSKK